MQLIDGQPVFSATDLVGYLACEHLTALERAALAGLVTRPDRTDPELDVIRRRGFQHEARYLAELRAEGRSIVEIARDDDADRGEQVRRQADDTIAAMASGADVIFQATFFDGRWIGHADFLLRVPSPERPSVWGPWHYEVADTKLARHVKAGAVLQMCSYVEQLERIQQVSPEEMYVVLGGSAREVATLRVADFMAYYRAAKGRFEASVLGTDMAPAPAVGYPPAGTYPEPVEHCDVCRWSELCVQRRRDDDHLSLVAGISARQRKALIQRGVPTLEALGLLDLPMAPPLDGTSSVSLRRIREQARIQLDGRREGAMKYELLLPASGEPIEPRRGLTTMPEPSPGDICFDIEGDPYAFDDGLEYLFGLMDTDGHFTALWSTDTGRIDGEFSLAGEKAAFERLIDTIVARLEADPAMHVYHFAPYETTAVKRLMGRHGTREEEVDRLLRSETFVDLHRAVRQGVRASVESYSIKKLEPLYDFHREVDLRDAGSSIVAFEEWLELGEGDRPAHDNLTRIEGYNRDDVQSNRLLRDWLEERRRELKRVTGLPVPRPVPEEGAPTALLAEHLQRIDDLTVALTADLPADPGGGTPDEHAQWLLAQLLSWNRREEKSFWWLYYHLKNDLTDEERVEASEPIGLLEYAGPVGEIAKSVIHRYTFPRQEHDIRIGGGVRDPATGAGGGEVVALDDAVGTIDLKRGRASQAPHPRSLIPFEHFDTREHTGSLLRIGDWVLANGIDAPGAYRAGRDLVLRRPPRLVGGIGIEGLRGEDDLATARRLALALDNTTLAIQGPPGSGKTYTGARMVIDLVAQGKRVGVTAMSHRVIANFLKEVGKAADQAGETVRIGQKCDPEDLADHPMVTRLGSNPEARDGLASRELDVVGGTTWLWTREEMAGSVHVLVVDEAGQMSLANVLAASPAGGSVVLLGDPQQLEQPLNGVHPPGAERSALAHLLDGAATMPQWLGLFLRTTWRLHPDICDFTSVAFYDGRLRPEDHLAGQSLGGPPPLSGTGLRLIGIDHEGNDSESIEEATLIADLARTLVEASPTWVDQGGQLQFLTWDQVLIVAPYNNQVGALRALLPEARIGTVDKFQGQEAPISIYSMTTSSPEDAPRGMDFLYSRNRLNVATSRARCVAVVVATPALLRVRARTPQQMLLANALCMFAEHAAGGRLPG